MTTPSPQPSPLTSLPQVEDLPQTEEGAYEAEAVREAFDSFRRHVLQLQAQLRVMQAAGSAAPVEPSGHAVRMDALHLIRAAAEFADVLERDAQNASAAQLQRTEAELSHRHRDLQDREREVETYREESERQRVEVVNAAKAESRELLANANRDAANELREAEAKGSRLLEQSRHQATELTNAARAEVEQTLEWARAQAGAILTRAQQGAEQLLTAAGLGSEALTEVSDAIVAAARATTETGRRPPEPEPKIQTAPEPGPVGEPTPPAPVVPPPPPASGPPPPPSQPAGEQDEDAS